MSTTLLGKLLGMINIGRSSRNKPVQPTELAKPVTNKAQTYDIPLRERKITTKGDLREYTPREVDPYARFRNINNPLSKRIEEFKTYDYRYGFSLNNHSTLDIEANQAELIENEIKTGGLLSCSAIAFTYEGLNFLAHVNTETQESTLENKIKEHPLYEQMKSDDTFKIYMWSGLHPTNHYAMDIIGSALENLGLIDKLSFLGYVSFLDDVGINQSGPWKNVFGSQKPRRDELYTVKSFPINERFEEIEHEYFKIKCIPKSINSDTTPLIGTYISTPNNDRQKDIFCTPISYTVSKSEKIARYIECRS